MSVKKWTGLMLALLIVTGFVFAEAEQSESQKSEVRERIQQATPAGRGRAGGGREEMYRQRMAQQAEMHRVEMQELLDIKKIAEEENAPKTAEAIQALIDKKNAAYQKGIEQLERARREREARLKERAKRIEAQKAKSETAAKENATKTAGEGEND